MGRHVVAPDATPLSRTALLVLGSLTTLTVVLLCLVPLLVAPSSQEAGLLSLVLLILSSPGLEKLGGKLPQDQREVRQPILVAAGFLGVLIYRPVRVVVSIAIGLLPYVLYVSIFSGLIFVLIDE